MAATVEHEQESDEDSEVYFLKPVNEYNIVDKIKEANKELFALENDGQDMSSANRRVSFAEHLEEYEPHNGSISTKELHEQLGKDLPQGQEIAALEPIAEEETIKKEQLEMQENDTSADDGKSIAKQDNDEAIEEICEEIIVMDMENEKSIKTESPGAMQRRMLKQITFDYDEEDNKSLTNLLLTDNEDDDDDDDEEEEDDAEHLAPNNIDNLQQDFNCNESLNEDTDYDDGDEHAPLAEYYPQANDNDDENDDDDDDKLSIIVASYLPNDDSDFDCDKASLTSNGSNGRSKIRKLPFNKRFSFRRKRNPNAISSSSTCNHKFQTPPEVTDLKLHYKSCCDYKNKHQKLPKYTGYLSEYGLSREQLQEREHKQQQKKRSLLHQTLIKSEDEMRQMHDNERAFTRWLKNKIRFPINKTRNMFDVKRPFGSGNGGGGGCAAGAVGTLRKATSVGNANCSGMPDFVSPKGTRYRSISAKFRKT